MYYNIKDIQKMTTDYILSPLILNELYALEKLIIIPTNEEIVKTNYVKTTTKQNDVWRVAKFKTTKIEVKTGINKNIDDIRISLNKISNKNYESQNKIIMEHLENFLTDEEALHKIAQFIFDIASANKFYSELYADLYLELVNKSMIFNVVLESYVKTYKSTIDNIVNVDANDDYDGYCQYVKENDKRRSMASFFVMLSKRGILEREIIIDIIKHFQKTFMEYIKEENKTSECEEISEILFILISLGNGDDIYNKAFSKDIIPQIIIMSKLKVKDYKSLTSRIIFKQLDLIDFLYDKR
jgi:hypothetical protein